MVDASRRNVPSVPKIHTPSPGAWPVTVLKRSLATGPEAISHTASTWSGARIVLPVLHVDATVGGHRLGRANPAHHRLVPDAHLHDVVAAQVSVVPPVERAVVIDESALMHGHVDGQDVAKVAALDQVLDRDVHLECMRGGYDLGYQVRVEPRGREHRLGLVGVHGHPRLGLDMLARLEGCQHKRFVHVGPCADTNRVGVVRFDKVHPIVVDGLDAEFVGDSFARFYAAVGHADQLHAFDFL
jgi:hypothetical protein